MAAVDPSKCRELAKECRERQSSRIGSSLRRSDGKEVKGSQKRSCGDVKLERNGKVHGPRIDLELTSNLPLFDRSPIKLDSFLSPPIAASHRRLERADISAASDLTSHDRSSRSGHP